MRRLCQSGTPGSSCRCPENDGSRRRRESGRSRSGVSWAKRRTCPWKWWSLKSGAFGIAGLEFDLREHQGTRWAAALQTHWATKVANGNLHGEARASGQALRRLRVSRAVTATLRIITQYAFEFYLIFNIVLSTLRLVPSSFQQRAKVAGPLRACLGGKLAPGAGHTKSNRTRPLDNVTRSLVVWQCHCSYRPSGSAWSGCVGQRRLRTHAPGRELRHTESTPRRPPRAPIHPASGCRCSHWGVSSALRPVTRGGECRSMSRPCTAASYRECSVDRCCCMMPALSSRKRWRQ